MHLCKPGNSEANAMLSVWTQNSVLQPFLYIITTLHFNLFNLLVSSSKSIGNISENWEVKIALHLECHAISNSFNRLVLPIFWLITVIFCWVWLFYFLDRLTRILICILDKSLGCFSHEIWCGIWTILQVSRN